MGDIGKQGSKNGNKMIEHSQKFLQARRFWVAIPIIVLPFLALVFWLIGGRTQSVSRANSKRGLNTALPDANLKNQSSLDKLSFYAMADHDSLMREEQLRIDPNYQSRPSDDILSTGGSDEILNRRIEKLQKQVEKPDYDERTIWKPSVESSAEIERLQMMMQSLNQKKSDPEIDALNSALDKLLLIQNPVSVKKESSVLAKHKLFAVSALGANSDRDYFGKGSGGSLHQFFSDSDEPKDSLYAGTIMAVVHSEQTLLVGTALKLRLLQDVFVNRERIPAGSFVFGNSSVDNERLKVVISSIQYQHRLYPVALTVFDMDGMEGIHIPGSAGRDVIKQSAEQGIQSVGGLSFDPSLKAQAAAAGVNVAKSLLSKKVKAERITVKAGYKVLLKDENEKSN
jgi:conjugative transposon TraM protein